jgi:hypothetical protein
MYTRFEGSGWSFQGECDISCGDCDTSEPLIIYRKPYETSQGKYRFWAIVCLNCKTIRALTDFRKEQQKYFQAWERTINPST